MEIEERPAEPFLLLAADKTDPGAFDLPLYLAFADPMNTPGLLLAPKMSKGFRFVIMDVQHTAGDRVIELNAPEDLYDLAVLLRDPERFVIESVWSRATGAQAVCVATSRLHNIGRLTGPVDAFAHPFWDAVRHEVAEKAMRMRQQGFFGAAMLPMSELEYTGIVEKLTDLEWRFQLRGT